MVSLVGDYCSNTHLHRVESAERSFVHPAVEVIVAFGQPIEERLIRCSLPVFHFHAQLSHPRHDRLPPVSPDSELQMIPANFGTELQHHPFVLASVVIEARCQSDDNFRRNSSAITSRQCPTHE